MVHRHSRCSYAGGWLLTGWAAVNAVENQHGSLACGIANDVGRDSASFPQLSTIVADKQPIANVFDRFSRNCAPEQGRHVLANTWAAYCAQKCSVLAHAVDGRSASHQPAMQKQQLQYNPLEASQVKRLLLPVQALVHDTRDVQQATRNTTLRRARVPSRPVVDDAITPGATLKAG
jgi:hypothetical protein